MTARETRVRADCHRPLTAVGWQVCDFIEAKKLDFAPIGFEHRSGKYAKDDNHAAAIVGILREERSHGDEFTQKIT